MDHERLGHAPKLGACRHERPRHPSAPWTGARRRSVGRKGHERRRHPMGGMGCRRARHPHIGGCIGCRNARIDVRPRPSIRTFSTPLQTNRGRTLRYIGPASGRTRALPTSGGTVRRRRVGRLHPAQHVPPFVQPQRSAPHEQPDRPPSRRDPTVRTVRGFRTRRRRHLRPVRARRRGSRGILGGSGTRHPALAQAVHAGARLVEPAVREVVRRWRAERRLQLPRPPRRGRQRRPRRAAVGRRARRRASRDLRGAHR